MKKNGFIANAIAIVGLTMLPGHPCNASIAVSGKTNEAGPVRIADAYQKLPLHFIENKGQLGKSVKFYEKGIGHTTFFTKEGVSLSLLKVAGKKGVQEGMERESELIKLIPLNTNRNFIISAEDKLEGKVHFFMGNDPKNWQRDISTYRTVLYEGIYDGIDIKFYGSSSQLEYDIIVGAGIDPSKVAFAYEGVEGLRVTDEGELAITLKNGTLIQKSPVLYQEINGERVGVAGKFKLLAQKPEVESRFAYSFETGPYNTRYPLIIDPVIYLSTYLGGGGLESGSYIATDPSGNAYIVGETNYYYDLPGPPSPLGTVATGLTDIFVTKVNAAGTAFLYSVYIGGAKSDHATGITVDPAGNAVISGITDSSDFPTVSPVQAANGGGNDAFVTKINAAGTGLTHSTYLGGSGRDEALGIATDYEGDVYVTGFTDSFDYPVVLPTQGTIGGYTDGFLSKISFDSSGNVSLSFSTFIGGTEDDYGIGVTVDGQEDVYLTGRTLSEDFPVVNPIQAVSGGFDDAFVVKVSSIEDTPVVSYSTYLGGSSYDFGEDIAVDAMGNAYIGGFTLSNDFPNISAGQQQKAGFDDAFVTKINSTGTKISYSTFIGGAGKDSVYSIAIDSGGYAHVTGSTDSSDFPVSSPSLQEVAGGGDDAFLVGLDSSGESISYSTFLGGAGDDSGEAIDLDWAGNVYLAGITNSSDFPLVAPLQGTKGASRDAFFTKISQLGINVNTLSLFEITKAKVKWKKGKVSVNGKLALSIGRTYSTLNARADISMNLPAPLGQIATGPVTFTVKGDEGEKWEYESDSGTTGLKKFKIDWKGAKFNYKDKIRIKSVLLSSNNSVFEIERRKVSGAFTVSIGSVSISFSDTGEVTASPAGAAILEEDDDGEVEVSLPFPLTPDMVIDITGAVTASVPVAQYYQASIGKFKIESEVGTGTNGEYSQTPELSLLVRLGDEGLFGNFDIGHLDWKDLSPKEWKFKRGH